MRQRVKAEEGTDLGAFLEADLRERRENHLWRELREISGSQGPEVIRDGRRVVNFSSNDYLGLAAEEFLREAWIEAAGKYGVGSGASRLISGSLTPHRELEEELAKFKQTEAALAFSCGYATAVGTLPVLAGPGDVIFLDKLSHACLVDGARLSGATLRIFPHNDVERLDSQLRWAARKHPRARLLIVTESVFSMDGDLAPLREMVEVKERYGAWLMVDEAHGMGVLGPEGRGLVSALGLGGRVEVQMGTLGKALGVAGGCVSGSRTLIDSLINRGRSFIFSTAPPPAQAAAATAALRWLDSPEGIRRVAALEENRRGLCELCPEQFPDMPASAIVPIAVGDESAALELAERFFESGLYLPAVRFPTVPRGRARLRLSLTASHRRVHLQSLVDGLRAFSSANQKEA